MTSRCLRDEVMGLAARLADECHPQVVLQHAEELARYARLTSACDALESFLGMRPRADDDVFAVLAKRRAEIADLIAHANLQAYEREAPAGLYLAISFFSRCSDKQPVWLLNRTEQNVTYLCRNLYAYAYKAVTTKNILNGMKQYLEQLSQVAELAGISVSELMANKPLQTFAEKTYGLGGGALAKKSGRPVKWSEQALFHLWAFVEREKPNYQNIISKTLGEYAQRFDVRISPDSLNTVYHTEAIGKSVLVNFCKKILEDPEKLFNEEFRKEERLQLIGSLADNIGEYRTKSYRPPVSG